MRLLLAEDERNLSDALAAILTHSGYSVDAVFDGQEALDYLESGEYDGVILDIMMPKMDGLTVLRTIRARGNAVPVLMLTAKGDVDDRVAGLDAGADDYLTKPFSSRELLARIRAMTRRQPALQEPDLRFGSVTLRRADFTLVGPLGDARLTNREFQMMEMLLANAGQTISTERFMSRIWGHDSDAEINVVWVNLSALRKKLTSIGADIRIKANRGLGYSLEILPEGQAEPHST